MNRWTRVFVCIYFVVQMSFQTILSSEVSEQTRWVLYWIFVGMAAVLFFDTIAIKVRGLIRARRSLQLNGPNLSPQISDIR